LTFGTNNNAAVIFMASRRVSKGNLVVSINHDEDTGWTMVLSSRIE
jgi:hypothetical protein